MLLVKRNEVVVNDTTFSGKIEGEVHEKNNNVKADAAFKST